MRFTRSKLKKQTNPKQVSKMGARVVRCERGDNYFFTKFAILHFKELILPLSPENKVREHHHRFPVS